MLFYLTLFSITSIGSFFELCNVNKNKKMFIAIFLMIIYIIIWGFLESQDWLFCFYIILSFNTNKNIKFVANKSLIWYN